MVRYAQSLAQSMLKLIRQHMNITCSYMYVRISNCIQEIYKNKVFSKEARECAETVTLGVPPSPNLIFQKKRVLYTLQK